MSYIRTFEELSMRDVALVGGKNAALGEMINALSDKGVRVPSGFALTADAYRAHLSYYHLEEKIVALLATIVPKDIATLQKAGRTIRELIGGVPLPPEITKEVEEAYAALVKRYNGNGDVALRSSATAEDLPEASFAGQQETFLNVRGAQEVSKLCPAVYASLFTDRAIIYRIEHGFDHLAVALSIGIQKMVRSDRASSGVMFTLDTESGFKDVILINAAYGLGEYVVQGIVEPDEFYVHKPTLAAGFSPVLKKRLGKKNKKLIYNEDDNGLTSVPVSDVDYNHFALTDDEILSLARMGLAIENYYSTLHDRWCPMDIEWAKDGFDHKIYIVQARPETVHSLHNVPLALTEYEIKADRATLPVLVTGNCIGRSMVSGRIKVIDSAHDIASFSPGEILVTDMTDPDWVPIMNIAAGIITNRGGRTCHAAIVSRELGIPALVGTGNATTILEDGKEVTLDCSTGLVGSLYEGVVPFVKHEVIVTDLPKAPCLIMLNVGNPNEAFFDALLPSDGVGLARVEFIINHAIQIHPMALVYPERITDFHDREKIDRLTYGYTDKKQFFIDTLAQEAGTIAAAFYPRPVIIRLSDFKSNEYRQLIAGDYFEPHEENPMLGFRGASRYYHDDYRAAFALECAAMKKIRTDMGLTNVKIMIPFVRTVDEGKKVIALMREYGLVQGDNGLEIIMMCEIPSNVILIDEFSKVFDGFSIGSNDLTQLVLGIDRDSHLIAPLFNERDPAVMAMLHQAIAGARRNNKPIGICGQGPSDYPDLAHDLIDAGINSISLNSDSLIGLRRVL